MRSWSKRGWDRWNLTVGAVITVYFLLQLVSPSQVAGSGSLDTLRSVLGVVVGLAAVLSHIPNAWVRASYDAREPLLGFDREKRLSESELPYNKFQQVGTHNSVHISGLFSMFVPYWRYTHRSLVEQLNMGIRHIELDLWFNMHLQRWEVWHECIDGLTVTPLLLSDTLSQLRSWSRGHRGHFPLCLNLDIKGAYRSGTSFLSFALGRVFAGRPGDALAFQLLEREILGEWGVTDLYTPATMLGGRFKTLRDALRDGGWPSVRSLRGKALFQLNVSGKVARVNEVFDSTVLFKRGHNFDRPRSDVAWFETADAGRAARLAAQGYLIRALDPHAKRLAAPQTHYIATNHPTRLDCAPVSVMMSSSNGQDRTARSDSKESRNGAKPSVGQEARIKVRS